jgi:hypothetical protein
MMRSGYGQCTGYEDQLGRGWSDVYVCGILFDKSESEAESFVGSVVSVQ